MGIFDGVIGSNGSYYGYTGIDDLMHEAAMNGEEDHQFDGMTIEEAVHHVAYENAQNLANITKAMAFNELATYVNTGAPMVYTEGTLGDIWSKIKAFFVKLWNKIKAVFKRLWMRASSMFMKKSEWAKKYKKEIAKAKVKSYGDSFKFEGYGYTETSMALNINESKLTGRKSSAFDSADKLGVVDLSVELLYTITTKEDDFKKVQKAIDDYKKEDADERRDKIRAMVYNDNIQGGAETSLDADDFKDKLIEKLRGGDDEKDEFDNINEQIRKAETYLLTGYKDFKKGYDKQLRKISHACDKIIKDMDKGSETFSKRMDKTEVLAKAKKLETDYNNLKKSSADTFTQVDAADVDSSDDVSRAAKARPMIAEYLHLFASNFQDYSTYTNDLMAIWTKEYNQWMNQSQALLMKAINHKKKESEDYHESYEDDYEGSYYTESSNSFLNGVELI